MRFFQNSAGRSDQRQLAMCDLTDFRPNNSPLPSAFPIEFRPSNPWPATDRRYQIASHFANAGCAVPEFVNDKWIQLAWSRLRSSGDAKTCDESDADLVFRWAAGPSAASCLGEPIAMLDELEARILAGQTNETIASRMPLSAGQVEAYERLLFAVRGKLTAPGYIRHVAIDGKKCRTPLGAFWCEFGFFGGPLALEWMVGAFRQLPADLQQLGLQAYLDPRAPALLRLAVQVRTAEVTLLNAACFSRYVSGELARISNWELPCPSLDFEHLSESTLRSNIERQSSLPDQKAPAQQPSRKRRAVTRPGYRKAG